MACNVRFVAHDNVALYGTDKHNIMMINNIIILIN